MKTSLKPYFEELKAKIFATLRKDEHLFLNLAGDDTQFIRINGAKVRQTGIVENFYLNFSFVVGSKENELKRGTGEFTLTFTLAEDLKRLDHWISRFREELPLFPIDPYAELPRNLVKSSSTQTSGTLLAAPDAVNEILKPCAGLDVAGLYSAGILVRAMANSAGLFHWFETETFSFDYSLYTGAQKALKSGYAGANWSSDGYAASIASARSKLGSLNQPSRKISRGDYRVYLAPAATDDLINMMAGAVSEFGIRKSRSALRFLRTGEKTLSSLFNLTEDFSAGDVPRFNDEGELAPEKQAIIENGKLVSTLVHSRTAKEFGIEANGAAGSESMRAPSVVAGKLRETEILSELETGLYLSNLHYLNWSDEVNGRITGMTRYACFWVENGKLICPIDNLRFDETIFDLFGSSLEAFTDFTEYLPVQSSYHYRQLGGARTPGTLLSKMHFSL